MNWRYKALAQWGFSLIPGGNHLNYMAQTFLTHSLPFSAEYLNQAIVPIARAHIDVVERHAQRPLEHLSFYEFGAGIHLSLPLLYWCFGVQQQTVTDLRLLARPDLVNHTIELLQAIGSDLRLARIPAKRLRPASFATDLVTYYGIDYRAPIDARDTRLPDASVDCITSTSTLEHIPRPTLTRVIAECARLLAPEGIASMIIDYKDHYSYFDRTLSDYNFLRYSDREWLLYNPPFQYQNRLRHSDYLTIVQAANLALVEERKIDGSERNRQELLELGVYHRFASRDVLDLAVKESHLVLKRSACFGPARTL
jgi:SAM-dependent methyltransferase